MLNEERKRIILDITNERKSITIIELMESWTLLNPPLEETYLIWTRRVC